MSQTVVVPIKGISDGDSSRWPERGLRRDDPQIYLIKLATRWMNETGNAVDGKHYILDKLPDGYALFCKNREANSTHVDRYLYGHPKYRFRSSEEFYEHFKNLMEIGDVSQCTCFGCKVTTRKRTPATANSSAPIRRRPGRPHAVRAPPSGELVTPSASNDRDDSPLPAARNAYSQVAIRTPPSTVLVDEEGTTDIYQMLTDKLKDRLAVDEPIMEDTSFDWKIDRGHIKRLLNSTKNQPRFLPRVGEIVLFVRGLGVGDSIIHEIETKRFQIWSAETQAYRHVPKWEAGLITQVPQEVVGLKELINVNAKDHHANYCSYLIEPMSEVGADEKAWSKRKAYIPLHQIRPFVFYKELLKGTNPNGYHPTVIHTLEIMSSFSLVEKYHFRGVWPSATIFNRGLYLGSELIMVGDTVRLQLSTDLDPTTVSDILRITSIKLQLIHLDAADNPEHDSVDGNGAEHNAAFDTCLHISGVAFTSDASRAWGMSKLPIASSATILPRGIAGYGDWYHLHDPERRWEIPFTQVIGRCFEDEAVRLWFSDHLPAATMKKESTPSQARSTSLKFVRLPRATQSPSGKQLSASRHDITIGLSGVRAARRHSCKQDTRIDRENGKSWFWADSRFEQLDLHEVRNVSVTPMLNGKPTREPQAWMRALMIRQKGPGFRTKLTQEEEESYHHASVKPRGRPPNASKSLMAASAMGGELIDSESDSTPQALDMIPAKAPVSSGEDEESVDAREEVEQQDPVNQEGGLYSDYTSDDDEVGDDLTAWMSSSMRGMSGRSLDTGRGRG